VRWRKGRRKRKREEEGRGRERKGRSEGERKRERERDNAGVRGVTSQAERTRTGCHTLRSPLPSFLPSLHPSLHPSLLHCLPSATGWSTETSRCTARNTPCDASPLQEKDRKQESVDTSQDWEGEKDTGEE
jgi:hypothetical protein